MKSIRSFNPIAPVSNGREVNPPNFLAPVCASNMLPASPHSLILSAVQNRSFLFFCFKSTNWKLPFCPTRFMNLHLRCTPVNFFNMYLCRIQNRDTYITRFYCKRQFRTTQQQRIRLFFRNIFLCYL